MYRFLLRPRWIAFHLLVAGAIVAMVNLGLWQLRRLDERQELNERVRASTAAAVVDLDDLLPASAAPGASTARELEWRRVRAAGEYLADRELRVVNRSQRGRAGDVVLTPLRLDDGRVLLVARGFVPLDADAAGAPAGPVEVVGRLRRSATRALGQPTDADPGDDLVPRVDIPALAAALDVAVVPMYVELVTSTPATDGFPVPLDEPELTNGPHLSYAVQWFVFAACVAAGWVLAVRRSAATAAQRAAVP